MFAFCINYEGEDFKAADYFLRNCYNMGINYENR